MYFEDMIRTEDTSHLFSLWQPYRMSVTEYIIKTVEHLYIKRALTSKKARRLKTKISLDEIVKEHMDTNGHKPSLAIWGAGGANDMDLARLSKYFFLVLIDHEKALCEQAMLRYGLTEKECAYVDLKFFDVSHEDYHMFEDVLISENIHLKNYFADLMNKMVTPCYENLPQFDYSVAVGLVSQLCTRFAGLAKLYDKLDVVFPYLQELSQYAVNSLFDCIFQMTNDMIVFGYEREGADVSEHQRAAFISLAQEEEKLSAREQIEENRGSKITGNDLLEQLLYEKQEQLFSHELFVWPFTEQYQFLMQFYAMDLK